MERRAITVEGTVQGVGFRPFVYSLAFQFGLGGYVKNQAGQVLIEVEGESATIDRFLAELESFPPPLARIEKVAWESRPAAHESGFRIESSDASLAGSIFISPDVATCDACLAEFFDRFDRRYHYPFLNCTHCGPRLTIIEGAPYDRSRTTMARFPMCPACRSEYDDPRNRRFHAQPTACASCGPRLILQSPAGTRIETPDPLTDFTTALATGKIGALKGLGGYHLVCDATSQDAVTELRRRKQRDERAFAVMVTDVEAAEQFCQIGILERSLLLSPRRPIVLLRKRVSSPTRIAEAVAPGNPYFGVMLPYTPVHHLLLRTVSPLPLLMTSGNRSDEPIAYLDHEAIAGLGSIADLFLSHDRPIRVRCDDSVTRVVNGDESPIRRSRGYAPEPVRLPIACPVPILAVGGQLKGVFALGRERQAILSHHMGDLDHWGAYRAFVRDIGLYEDLFATSPQAIVHDLHPDYASTNYARERAASDGLPVIAVQHHHAHMASCMAEHGLDEPVIGVSLDGTGLGLDGAIWGGEFLIGDYRQFRRAAHLRYVGMPGADKAIHEPWRMAVAHLHDADCPFDLLESRIPRTALRTVETMLNRGFNSPLTSSAGRLFDAVASIVGVRDRVSFEGQAAQQLEWMATDEAPAAPYPYEIARVETPSSHIAQNSPVSLLHSAGWKPGQSVDMIDTRPLIQAIVADVESGVAARRIARRFHSTMVDIIENTCSTIREATQIGAIVLSGGVFMNVLIATETAHRLLERGFRVYRHRAVPPNDGGLALGQLAVAAAALASTPKCTAFQSGAPRKSADCPSHQQE
jgi:hydrogenase maturation protein HypF